MPNGLQYPGDWQAVMCLPLQHSTALLQL